MMKAKWVECDLRGYVWLNEWKSLMIDDDEIFKKGFTEINLMKPMAKMSLNNIICKPFIENQHLNLV